MNNTNEIMCKRLTADGKVVQFWNDGVVTVGLLAEPVKGSGVSRGPREILKDIDACWLLAGEVELYDLAELQRAVAVARRATRNKHANPLTYFRQVMAGKRMVCHMNALGSVAVVTFKAA